MGWFTLTKFYSMLSDWNQGCSQGKAWKVLKRDGISSRFFFFLNKKKVKNEMWASIWDFESAYAYFHDKKWIEWWITWSSDQNERTTLLVAVVIWHRIWKKKCVKRVQCETYIQILQKVTGWWWGAKIWYKYPEADFGLPSKLLRDTLWMGVIMQKSFTCMVRSLICVGETTVGYNLRKRGIEFMRALRE